MKKLSKKLTKMGIKKINEILKEICPDAFQEADCDQFKGLKIAVDANLRINKIGAIAHKNCIAKLKNPSDIVPRFQFLDAIKRDLLFFIFGMTKYGILPIFIFDGPKRELKTETIKKRSAPKIRNREKIAEAIAEYETMDPYDLIDGEIETTIRKMRASDFYITLDELMSLKEMLESIGFPCFRAKHDGEKLCASLSIEGLVSGVLTTDTDCYPLGVENTIIDFRPHENKMTIVVLDEIIISFMEMFECNEERAYEIFLDYCIMCGCDFNQNVPRIAGKTALKKLKQNEGDIKQSFDGTIPECLNYEDCLEIFSHEDSGLTNLNLTMQWEMFDENCQDLVNSFDSFPLRNSMKQMDRSSITTKFVKYTNGI